MSDYDPNVLGACENAYDEGYGDAVIDIRRSLRGAGIANVDDIIEAPDPEDRENPYTKMREDRIAYVEQQVRESFTVCDEDGEDIFDQTDFIEAILDAHADWIADHGGVQPGSVLVELPVVAHKGPYDTEASIFRQVAWNLENAFAVGGSNVTAAVVALLRRVADAAERGESK